MSRFYFIISVLAVVLSHIEKLMMKKGAKYKWVP